MGLDIHLIIGNLKAIQMAINSHPPLFYGLVSGGIVFIGYLFIKLNPWVRIEPFISDRWANLDLQLASVKKGSDKLALRFKKSGTLSDRALSSLKTIKEIYWDFMRNPLTKVLVVGWTKTEAVMRGLPFKEEWGEEAKQFLKYLQGTPPLAGSRPFCGLDVERLLAYTPEIPKPENLVFINKYMMDNSFEFCFPCFDGDNLNGAIFLGSKRRGIFWPQELRALQMISQQIGTAVEKVNKAALQGTLEKV